MIFHKTLKKNMHFVNGENFWDIDSNFHAIYLNQFFFLSLVFLGFLAYPGSEPLADYSQTRWFQETRWKNILWA